MTMQTPDQKKQMFLEMQKHPEKFSDQQIEAMMDELDQEPDVEKAWQEFIASAQPSPSPLFTLRSPLGKIAAAFFGVLLMSGIALAAIHIVRTGTPRPHTAQAPQTEQTAETKPVSEIPADTLATDTLAVKQRIFENVPLDTMLLEMAGHYHVAVDFQRDEARQLRLYFFWKSDESLDQVVERLNNFEAVNIIREPEKLIVR